MKTVWKKLWEWWLLCTMMRVRSFSSTQGRNGKVSKVRVRSRTEFFSVKLFSFGNGKRLEEKKKNVMYESRNLAPSEISFLALFMTKAFLVHFSLGRGILQRDSADELISRAPLDTNYLVRSHCFSLLSCHSQWHLRLYREKKYISHRIFFQCWWKHSRRHFSWKKIFFRSTLTSVFLALAF